MTVEEYRKLNEKPISVTAHDDKIARAKQACDCDPAQGIAVSCCISELPKLSIVPGGEFCWVALPEFKCPRHEIMEW